MKISCNSQTLVEAVLNVGRAVSNKSCFTALEGILISAKGSKVSLCGYNLEIGITTEIEAEVIMPGSIVLSAKIFSDIIRRSPEEQILISTDEKLITTIKSGSSEFSIIGIAASEYPELPLINSHALVELDSSVLKSMIKQTLFAVSENDEKPINTGILFDVNENELTLVSVDGFRLAKRTETISHIETAEKLNFVVPGRTLSEIFKLIIDDKNVQINVGQKHIMFKIENYCVISRLLEGEFLDYNAAIPKTQTTELVVNTRMFIQSVERVSLVITDRLKSPVRCLFSGDSVKISCITALGRANDEFAIELSGEELEIGFNNKFLLDALKNTETDQVRIHMTGPLGPMKIMPKDGEAFVFLVLPVRLKAGD